MLHLSTRERSVIVTDLVQVVISVDTNTFEVCEGQLATMSNEVI